MLVLIVVAVYLLSLIAVGVVKARSVDGQATFSLAGRGLGIGVLVGTLLATWTGTGSIFANAEEAYRVGPSALVLPLASVIGITGLIFMVPHVRRHGRFTLQDVLEERFGPVARVLGTLTLVSAYVIIVSYQLRAGAAVLERLGTHAGIGTFDRTAVLALVAVFVGTYTALAGMMSVALTDTFNGVLMTAGVAVALPFAWAAAGGLDGIGAAFAEGPRAAPSAWVGVYGGFDLFSMLVPPFLLVLGDANLHTRFLSARSAGAARWGAMLLIPGVLVVDALIILVAIAGRAAVPDLDQGGKVVLEVALTTLPVGVGALLVAAILAIVVSTADSFLLSSTTSLVRDVYQRFVHRAASERALLRAARLTVALLTLLAFQLALLDDRYFDVALFAYTIYGVGITPVLLAALFWRRATPAGAVTAMLASTATAIAWRAGEFGVGVVAWLGLPDGTRFDAVMPALLVATVVLVGVSLVTPARVATEPLGRSP